MIILDPEENEKKIRNGTCWACDVPLIADDANWAECPQCARRFLVHKESIKELLPIGGLAGHKIQVLLPICTFVCAGGDDVGNYENDIIPNQFGVLMVPENALWIAQVWETT